jgi:hypothetical protein
MEVIMTLLAVGVGIFSIYSLISHMGNHNSLKYQHAEVLSGLAPNRSIHNGEIINFQKVFKKDLPISTKVFKHRGLVGYISLEVNHSENKEFTIGGIRIHPNSYKKLAHKKIGLKLDDYLPDEEKVKTELEDLKKRSETENMSEEKLLQKIEALRDQYFHHDFEFIFLKEDNMDKQAAHIISIGDWKLATWSE